MEQVAGHRDQMTAEAIADLILSFEKAKPERLVIAEARSGKVAYAWDHDAADYVASVLCSPAGNLAWLDGPDVHLLLA